MNAKMMLQRKVWAVVGANNDHHQQRFKCGTGLRALIFPEKKLECYRLFIDIQ